MRKSFFTILISFTFVIVNGQNLQWIKFEWHGDSIGQKYFDKLSILIPFQIDNLPYKFNAQFDLGAVTTMLYGNSISPFLKLNPSLNSKIDTSSQVLIQGQKNPLLKDVELKLDNMSFGKRNIALFKGYGDTLTIDSINTNTVKHIGTIAPDLFKDHILIIDYPNKRIALTEELPKSFNKATFQKMEVHNGRIKIPFTVADSTHNVMFDTGSSIFELITDEENLKRIAKPNSPVLDSLQISSWGQYHYVNSRAINNLKVGSKSFPNAKVYLWKGRDYLQFNKKENIIGATGNALFLNNTIIIDYKTKRFGIL